MTACSTANVADSLMAIKAVFDDKSYPCRICTMVMNNWKATNSCARQLSMKCRITATILKKLTNWPPGPWRFSPIPWPGQMQPEEVFRRDLTATANVYMGAELGATPDGRKAGEPIADAISPRQGFDRNGPTAYLRSAAKLPHRKLSNGDQLNIRFTPTSVEGDRGAEKLKQLIKAYFKLGGMQVQFNVVNTQTLRKAQDNPDEYKDLIVRIAGFSTYFVTLNRQTQDDFISRHRAGNLKSR